MCRQERCREYMPPAASRVQPHAAHGWICRTFHQWASKHPHAHMVFLDSHPNDIQWFMKHNAATVQLSIPCLIRAASIIHPLLSLLQMGVPFKFFLIAHVCRADVVINDWCPLLLPPTRLSAPCRFNYEVQHCCAKIIRIFVSGKKSLKVFYSVLHL